MNRKTLFISNCIITIFGFTAIGIGIDMKSCTIGLLGIGVLVVACIIGLGIEDGKYDR